jgi:hypothetical protein
LWRNQGAGSSKVNVSYSGGAVENSRTFKYRRWCRRAGGSKPDISQNHVSGAAIPHRDWLKAVTLFSRFPELYEEFRGIKKKVEALEKQLKKMEGA